MPKYTNTKTGQVFNSPRPLTADELQTVFSQGAPPAQDNILSPDVEALRQRNMANAMNQSASPFTRSMQNIGEAARAPYNAINQGFEQAKTQPIAGGINMLNAAVSTPFAPVNAAVQGLRELPGFKTPIGNIYPGEGLANLVSAPFWALGKAVDLGTQGIHAGLGALGIKDEPTPEGQALNNLNQTMAQLAFGPAVIKGLPKVPEQIGGAIEAAGTKLMGTAMKLGETPKQVRTISNWAQERGITLSDKGFEKSRQIAQNMNNAINNDIIEPATQAGQMIDGRAYLEKMQAAKSQLENQLIPDRASIMTADRMIKAAQDRLSQSSIPGKLSPREAQDLKVINNNILENVYNKRNKMGGLTEKETAKNQVLIAANDMLRSQLEDLHPELRGLNWEEGRAIPVSREINNYITSRAKGDAGVMLGRFGVGKNPFGVLSISNLMGTRGFRSKVAVLLGQIGRGISQRQPYIKEGVTTPYSPPPQPQIAGLLPEQGSKMPLPDRAPSESIQPPSWVNVPPTNQPYVNYGTVSAPQYQRLLPSPATQLGMEQPPAGIRTWGPPFYETGNRLLPPPSVTIAPEYLSQSQGYPMSAPQMADLVRAILARYAIPEK